MSASLAEPVTMYPDNFNACSKEQKAAILAAVERAVVVVLGLGDHEEGRFVVDDDHCVYVERVRDGFRAIRVDGDGWSMSCTSWAMVDGTGSWSGRWAPDRPDRVKSTMSKGARA